ncbi:MAG: hypothetical protein HY876_06070, partial [Coriobacteriales bacterium]|nr:hypothetical protein [Coriobacteriales bacterium]
MESTLDLDLRLGSVLGAHPQAPAALALLLDRDPHDDDLFDPPRALGDDVRVQLL